ncbi:MULTISPECIES: hypothetical protein [unclassified Rhizobium]|uniref:hypothetical protein n=1 Tax=unclassified Rhizobium TaxID=2613769 RepID=UPI001619872A|nr:MULTISPECIES: hypothetical protein [unclassified Rhizobium]MBB3290870.1 hypothetical protein [Rhizobium sp. BK252]MBB3405650.1 hypothetical protein [Rhizobium sp. BK289]MBB3418197.1 hypothetical protein [Rhizobium sp. BK284]MBB3486121.1 hypothetical protein [Rhizobium sp. BK347]
MPAFVADTAPKEAIGLTGGLFHAEGDIGGLIVPVAIAYIIEGTGSHHGALLSVELHVIDGISAIECWSARASGSRFQNRLSSAYPPSQNRHTLCATALANVRIAVIWQSVRTSAPLP